VGEKVHALEEASRARVAYISRLGEAMLPIQGTVLQEGDVLHVVAMESDLARIGEVFGRVTPDTRRKGGH
jgi:trk system potassium uptake protein TrkA